MKNDLLTDAFGMLDDSLLDSHFTKKEALLAKKKQSEPRETASKSKILGGTAFYKWGVVAACFCVCTVLFLSVLLPMMLSSDKEIPSGSDWNIGVAIPAVTTDSQTEPSSDTRGEDISTNTESDTNEKDTHTADSEDVTKAPEETEPLDTSPTYVPPIEPSPTDSEKTPPEGGDNSGGTDTDRPEEPSPQGNDNTPSPDSHSGSTSPSTQGNDPSPSSVDDPVPPSSGDDTSYKRLYIYSLRELEEIRSITLCGDESKVEEYLSAIDAFGINTKDELMEFLDVIDSLPVIELVDGDITRIYVYYDAKVGFYSAYIITKAKDGSLTQMDYYLSVKDIEAEIQRADYFNKPSSPEGIKNIQNTDKTVRVYYENKYDHFTGIGKRYYWTVSADNILVSYLYYTPDEHPLDAEELFSDAHIVHLADIAERIK